MEGLNWQVINVPFGYGTEQKANKLVLDPPNLAVAKDVSFAELGGLQTRKPFTSLGVEVDANSTAIAVDDMRRIERFGGELLLFTKDRLYSRRVNESKWSEKGTHLAIATTETPRFVTTGDQEMCDRVELAGVTIYSWHEVRSTGATYGYIAAVETATGNVILPPYELPGLDRIRLIALETKVLLVYYDGITGHYCYALDPADPSAAFAGPSTTVHTGGDTWYDAVKVPGADQAAIVVKKNPATSYQVLTMTAGLVRNQATKARSSASISAIAVTPDGLKMQIIRRAGADYKGDLLDVATLADIWTNQTIGTVLSSSTEVAAEFSSVAIAGEYTCRVFWDDGGVQTNTVTTANVMGAAARFVGSTVPASRAFDHEGRVYVWLSFHVESTFSGDGSFFSYALQNTYFLYREDGFLCAKAVAAVGGGGNANGGWLPGVQALDATSYAWAGIRRRVVRVGGSGKRRHAYGARSPQDITFSFDSDEARRCVRLGGTLYITGGEILQYDGVQLTEVGFHIYPYFIIVNQVAGGDVEDGTYGIKLTARWDNGVGEIDRSTSATVGSDTVTGGPAKLQVSWEHLPVTHKTKRPIAIEAWRTLKNPGQDDPFYQASSLNPGDATNPNRYLQNDIATTDGDQFEDELADVDIKDLGTESQAVIGLEPLAPPPATVIAASNDRIFLAGIAGDPDRVWYSRLRGDAEVAAFNDVLTFPVPAAGGAITAICCKDELVTVFRERAIYVFAGGGIDNAGGGQNYTLVRTASNDVGAESAEAVCIEPGGIVFHGVKGKYRLGDGGQSLTYIGSGVCDFDSEPVLAIHVLEKEHEIRWLTPNRMLVLDYLAATQQSPEGQWCEWTLPSEGAHATMWNATHVVLTAQSVLQQRTDYTGVDYGMVVETSWIKASDLQGSGRIRKLLLLGENRGASAIRFELFRNYETTPFQTKDWPLSPAVIGAPLDVKFGPRIQRFTALKVRISVVTPTNEALKLAGLGLEVGIKPGLRKDQPAAQRS